MSQKKRERMSSVDTAWLRMDRASNLMMICGVLLLREQIGLRQLQTTLARRFLRFRRFGQRPVQTPAGAYWEPDTAFDITAHVQRIALPGRSGKRGGKRGGKIELEALTGRLMSEPLDPARPLWQFHLVEHYEGGSAVIARIHHCYADGIALIQVMLSMTDADREGKRPGLELPSSKGEDEASADTDPLASAMRLAMKTGSTLVERAVDAWHEPAKAVAIADQGSALTAEIAKLALMGEDTRTRFKGKPGVLKRTAWAEPLPLDEVKTIGRAFACSINDVLLSSVAGALRSYLVHRGDVVDGVMLRALVPVNLRPVEKAYKLGNRFGLVFLDLPIGIENPVERLYAVRANMQALKGSFQPVLALGILAAMGVGPKVLQEHLLALLARNATAVMTNVPGPQIPLFLAGARIDKLMFWVPQSGDIGMGVSILSYDGAVQFGLVTDRALCPDPEHIVNRVKREFEQLVLATLLSPWPWIEPPSADQVASAVVG